MRTVLLIGLGIVVVMALAVVGLAAGWALWGRQIWTAAPAYAPDGGVLRQERGSGYGRGPGMMPGVAPSWGNGTFRVERDPAGLGRGLARGDLRRASDRGRPRPRGGLARVSRTWTSRDS